MSTDWALKITALLHDPPGKVLGLADHQRRAFRVMEQVLGTSQFRQLFGTDGASLTRKQFEAAPLGKLVKKADAIASAIDRTAFPDPVRLGSADYLGAALIKHPLAGTEIPLPAARALHGNQTATDRLGQAQLNAVAGLTDGETDLRCAYLGLWRGLPNTAPDPETRLLPADTRMVDHTLWQHLDATAALATALPQPALLIFDIGPVQGFITEARRTQDLWMGSYLLSYLTWAAIKVLVEEAGPDAVLYPALRGQPLVDHWLWSQGLWPKKPDPEGLATATIPSKFVALLPADQAEEFVRQATDAVRKTWREVSARVKAKFPGGARPGVWEQIWKRQLEADDWPEVYWSILAWPDLTKFMHKEEEAERETDKQVRKQKLQQIHVAEAEAAIQLDEQYLGTPSPFRNALDVYKTTWPEGINSGTLYGRLDALANRGFEARKALHDFSQIEEDGEKCTVSGVRSALRPDGAQTRQEVRKYWQEVARVLRHQGGRYHEVKPDGRERLSAIVAVKRFAQRDYFDSTLGLQGGFPSTSRVAAAPFYAALLEKLDMLPELQQAVYDHLDVLKRMGFPDLSEEAAKLSLPYLTERAQSDLAWQLLMYDADILFEETFAPERLRKDYGVSATRQQANEAAARCRKLLNAARNAEVIPPAPPKYYALLMLDGDEMGKWLSGGHGRFPRLKDAFHPDIIPLFASLPDGAAWEPILYASRPLSAALHNSISHALSDFALRCVRQVVEQRYSGRVVYAGGDDAMALSPAQDALAAARELRALFSGQADVKLDAEGNFQQVSVRFGDPSCAGYLRLGEDWILTMGPRATASVGIVLAHHMYPLDSVLAAAREAKKAAKEVYGRNAVAVYFLRRSGERQMIGSKWWYEGGPGDPLAFLDEMRQHFAGGHLADGFAYALNGEAPTLVGVSFGAQRAELARLLDRHSKLRRQEVGELATRLTQWTTALNTHWPGAGAEADKPAPGMIELSKWILLARYLAQGGGE